MEQKQNVAVVHPCLYCEKEIPHWRRNKKFCDDSCKYRFHNDQRELIDENMKRVNKILSTNYEILKEVIGEQSHIKIAYSELKKMGFQFDFLTQIKGDYHNCYTLSWKRIEDEKLLISRVPKSTYRGMAKE